jgi:hypothetical protein
VEVQVILILVKCKNLAIKVIHINFGVHEYISRSWCADTELLSF